jgi:hypothetical protein
VFGAFCVLLMFSFFLALGIASSGIFSFADSAALRFARQTEFEVVSGAGDNVVAARVAGDGLEGGARAAGGGFISIMRQSLKACPYLC